MSIVHSFLSRIRVRERLSRDESAQRPPEWSPDRHQASRQQKTVPQHQPSPGHQPTHGQTVHPPSAPDHYHAGLDVDHQPYLAMPAPVSTAKQPGPPEVQPWRRVSADQSHAAHREAKLEARQALKEEAHTAGLLKSRKAVLPSEIRRREKSVDDPHRGPHEDMDWQSCGTERRRESQAEEDWSSERPRERGRERMAERVRDRGKEHLSSHDSQSERALRSMEHSHSSPHQQPRQRLTSDPVGHQEPQTQHHELLIPQYDPQKRQYGGQIHQQDTQMEHQYDLSRHPPELQRQQQSQGQQEYETRAKDKELTRMQEESHRKHHESQIDQDYESQRQKQQDSSGQQRSDSGVYLQKGSSLPQAKHRSMETSVGPKPKTRTRSMSDIGVSEHSAMYRRVERAAASRETASPSQHGRDGALANGDVSTLDTRVSVAQLRHSYLENANRKPEL